MEIFDYIVLSDTTKNSLVGDTYSFLIPPTYYNEQRSPVARVELIQLHLTKHGSKKVSYITTSLTGRNVYYNKGSSVLAVLANDDGNTYSKCEPIYLSTIARPSKIDIAFHEPDDNKFQPTDFKAVLKFSYGNPKDTSERIEYQN